jgi:hypothetical protein
MRRLRFHALVYALYLAVAILITWPLLRVFSTEFLGHPFSDTYEYARHIWWFRHALATGQPLYFQPWLGYPDGLNGAWLWAIPLQSFPAWVFALVLPLPAALNLSTLLRLALNGWAMFVLADHLTGRGPALMAGLIFMTFPAFQGQLALGHTGLLALWPVPLMLWALLRLRDSGGWRRIGLAGLLWSAGLWGSFTSLVYLVGPVTLLLLLLEIVQRRWLVVRRMLLAVGLGVGIELLLIGPFFIEQAQSATLLNAGGSVQFSADLLSVFTPSFFHPLFTHLPYTHQVLGIDPFERLGYIGLVALILALVGVWRSRLARPWLLLALVAWVFSLGPLLKLFDRPVVLDLGGERTFVTLPWAALQALPVLNSTRTPARFHFSLALAVALLASYGAAQLKRHRWLLAVLALLVLLEYQSFWPLPTIPGTVPPAVQALAERADVGVVLNLPWNHLLAQKDGMFLQTGHQQPLLAGHIARRTPVDPAKLTLLQKTLDPALLQREQVDIVIWHKQWAEDEAEGPRRVFGSPLYEDVRIAVFEVPDVDTAPIFQAALPADHMLEDQLDLYFFAPEPGWVLLRADLNDTDKLVTLNLDGQFSHVWPSDVAVDLRVPVTTAGYHTLTLHADPPCPAHAVPTLRCPAVAMAELVVGPFTPQPLPDAVQFDRGVTLRVHQVEADDDAVAVDLWWDFAQARSDTDIRFVHVVNAAGELVVQDDRTLGAQLAGGTWLERVELTGIPPGDYRVYAGWYTFPDFTRFAVQSDVPGAADGWVQIAEITVEG